MNPLNRTNPIICAIGIVALLLFPSLVEAKSTPTPTPIPTATPIPTPKPTAADAVNALGSAGPSHWTLLGLGGGTITTQGSSTAGSVSGNVGVAANGKLQDNTSPIYGNLYLGSKASAQFSGKYTNNRPVSGTSYLSPNSSESNGYSYTTSSGNYDSTFSQALADATNASKMASSLTPTSSLTQINLSNANLSLSAGVYNLSTFSLKNSTLTLSGSGYFVFNITSTFSLSSGNVLLANGATEPNVLFNRSEEH